MAWVLQYLVETVTKSGMWFDRLEKETVEYPVECRRIDRLVAMDAIHPPIRQVNLELYCCAAVRLASSSHYRSNAGSQPWGTESQKNEMLPCQVVDSCMSVVEAECHRLRLA